MESILDDAIAVAEVEMGEPKAQEMVATQDESHLISIERALAFVTQIYRTS